MWVNLIAKKSETSSEESLGDEDNNDGANCIENHLGSVKCSVVVGFFCACVLVKQVVCKCGAGLFSKNFYQYKYKARQTSCCM